MVVHLCGAYYNMYNIITLCTHDVTFATNLRILLLKDIFFLQESNNIQCICETRGNMGGRGWGFIMGRVDTRNTKQRGVLSYLNKYMIHTYIP